MNHGSLGFRRAAATILNKWYIRKYNFILDTNSANTSGTAKFYVSLKGIIPL